MGLGPCIIDFVSIAPIKCLYYEVYSSFNKKVMLELGGTDLNTYS